MNEMNDILNLRKQKIALIEKLPYGKGALLLPNATLVRETKKHYMIECLTLDNLTEKMFYAIDEYRDYKVISNRTQEFIVKHLLDEYGDALKYFTPLKNKKGFAKELLSLFTELRRSGIKDGENLRTIFAKWQENDRNAPLSKNEDVCQFFSLYIFYLQKNKLYDLEGQYMLVIEGLKQGKIQNPYEKLVMSDFDLLNHLEEELAVQLGLCNKGEYSVPDKVEFILPQQIEFRYCASHRDEIMGIYQEINDKVNKGAKYEDFLIVVSKLQNFPGARHLADRLGIPVTVPRTDKVSQYPLMRNLKANLGNWTMVEEFVANLQNYLDNEEQRTAIGRQYAEGKIDLLELKNYFAWISKVKQILQGLMESAKVCSFMNNNLTGDKFWQYFVDASENESYTIMQGDEKGVLLTTFVGAIGFPRKYLYVVGLNEEEFPPKLRENWIYSDRERKCFNFDMGVELPNVMTRYKEAIYLFSKMLIMGLKEVYFSWTKADNMDRSTYVDMLQQKLREVNLIVIEKDLRGENYHNVIGITEDEDLLRDLSQCDRERVKSDSPFDGKLQINWGAVPIKMSSSKLKTYMECPFKYLVRYIWNMDIPYDFDDAIDNLDKGNFLHKVIARYFNEIQPNVVEDEKAELLRVCTEEAQALQSDDSKKYKDYFDKDIKLFYEEIEWLTAKILRWYDLDKNERQQNQNMQSFANEKSFGNNEAGGVELILDLSHKVLFNGFIDHIDEITMKDGSKRYYITDYKLGDVPSGDVNVQVPLYVAALSLEYPDCLIGGSYFGFKKIKREKNYPKSIKFKEMVGNEDDYRSNKKNPIFLEKFRVKEKESGIENTSRLKLEELIRGNFTPISKNCNSCPIKSICRKGKVSE